MQSYKIQFNSSGAQMLGYIFGAKREDDIMSLPGCAGGNYVTHNQPVWIDPKILTPVMMGAQVVINILAWWMSSWFWRNFMINDKWDGRYSSMK